MLVKLSELDVSCGMLSPSESMSPGPEPEELFSEGVVMVVAEEEEPDDDDASEVDRILASMAAGRSLAVGSNETEASSNSTANEQSLQIHKSLGMGSTVGLTGEQRMRFEVASLLVDACSSLIAARRNGEEGEIVDTATGVPANILNAMHTYRPTGPLEAILYDDRKSKTEQAWGELEEYVGALVMWVERTRSATFVPLKGLLNSPATTPQVSIFSTTPSECFSETDAGVVAHIAHREDKITRQLKSIQSRRERCSSLRLALDRRWRVYDANRRAERQSVCTLGEKQEEARVLKESTLERLARLESAHVRQIAEIDAVRWHICEEQSRNNNSDNSSRDGGEHLEPLRTSFKSAKGTQFFRLGLRDLELEVEDKIRNAIELSCASQRNTELDRTLELVEGRIVQVVKVLRGLGHPV